MAPRPTARALTVSAAAAGAAAAGITVQRRHLRRLAADEDYSRLSEPLGGRPFTVTSPDGTRLHAEAFGAPGDATVVLAHGWTEQLRFWGPVIRRLTDAGLRPVAFDLRGHGRSAAAAKRDYSLERFGEDMEAVLSAATAEGERAVVAGHSLGAMSIAAWAEHHDVGVHARGAALINTGLGDLVSGSLLFGELARRFSSPLFGRLLLGSRAPMPAFSSPLQHAVIRHAAFGPDATAGMVAFYERMLISCPPDARAAVGAALTDMDLWDAVARLAIPTAVIAGDRDRLTPPAHARRIAEALPQPAGVTLLPDTGHMGPLERPAEIARVLVGLVADSAPVSGAAPA